MYQEIPLDSTPGQSFTITLSVDNKNVSYGFFLRWNDIAKYWTMDILVEGVQKLTGIPLLVNQNLLGQYQYLQIGSAYLIRVSDNQNEQPDDTNLGTDFILVWGDTDG